MNERIKEVERALEMISMGVFDGPVEDNPKCHFCGKSWLEIAPAGHPTSCLTTIVYAWTAQRRLKAFGEFITSPQPYLQLRETSPKMVVKAEKAFDVQLEVEPWTCDNHREPITYTDGTTECYCGNKR